MPLPTHFVPDWDAVSNFVDHQPLSRYLGGGYKMLLSMDWARRGDGNCIIDLDLPGIMIRTCLEQVANVDTVVMGDFGVAEFAHFNTRGFNYWSEIWLFFIVRYHKRILGW